LFVLRLRTGIDLRDQADLAPTRSVTIGSWFSDCIGTSSLARHSRVVRVTSHQIEVISTHRKIGHFDSISLSLCGLRGVERQVGLARWTPWPNKIKCGPHGGKKSKTKLGTVSWLSLKTKVELVQGSGQVIERGKTE
jgi:hypothetical protein